MRVVGRLVGLGLAMVGLTAPAGAQEQDLGAVLRQAWRHSPGAVQAQAALDRARAEKEGADRRWWPSVTLGSPTTVSGSALPLFSGQADDQARTAAGALGASVVQPLPGGGQLVGHFARQEAQTWGTDGGTLGERQGSSLWGLGYQQPLGGDDGRRLETLTLDRAEVGADRAQLLAFAQSVELAAALDQARAVEAWKAAVEAAAEARAQVVQALGAQGRASRSDQARADRELRTARWDRQEAQAARQAADEEWRRWAGAPLPDWPVDRLVLSSEFEQWLGGWAPAAGEEADARWEAELVRARDLRARQAWAPTLGLTLEGTKPDKTGATWAGQVSLKWSTDGLLQGGAADRARDAELSRLASLETGAAGHRLDRTAQKTALRHQAEDAAARLTELRSALGQEAAETEALARTGQATQVEALALAAELSAVDAEVRRLAWVRLETWLP